MAPLAGPAATPSARFLPEFINANLLAATKPVSGYSLPAWAGLIGAGLIVICPCAAVPLAVGDWLLARRDA